MIWEFKKSVVALGTKAFVDSSSIEVLTTVVVSASALAGVVGGAKVEAPVVIASLGQQPHSVFSSSFTSFGRRARKSRSCQMKSVCRKRDKSSLRDLLILSL